MSSPVDGLVLEAFNFHFLAYSYLFQINFLTIPVGGQTGIGSFKTFPNGIISILFREEFGIDKALDMHTKKLSFETTVKLKKICFINVITCPFVQCERELGFPNDASFLSSVFVPSCSLFWTFCVLLKLQPNMTEICHFHVEMIN